MTAIEVVAALEKVLAELSPEMQGAWIQLDKMAYLHAAKEGDSPWASPVVGRFDYLPAMPYMLAAQPLAIRTLLDAYASLKEAIGEFLESQDALDNRELMGPNAEDYFVLMHRRNSDRNELDREMAALDDNTKGAAE